MWTLQRPNKGPDKKWRLNKESKYSSLLRPKKEQQEKEAEPPRPPFPYRPLEALPDPRMMDPRAVDPRMINPRVIDPKMMVPRVPGGARPFDPRMMDPNYHDPRPVPVPQNNDPVLMDPRNPPKIGDPCPMDPRMMAARTLDTRVPESKAIYARPMETKRPPRAESNSSEESEDEPYGRIRSKPEWVTHSKRDASLDQRPERLVRDQRGHHSEMDLRMKPLQELNGRDKHVERFLASLEDNSASPAMEVVSRQRILSRSRDDLNDYEDEDVWYDLDELVKEHIHEILKKWEQIDDGIWAKAIVFEKNRRVAKAYVRPPILTINGSDVGFDGHRIGLKGFDNPMRDAKTLEVISRYVGPGVKIRMDNKGNIEVKKLSQYNVYAKPLGEENAISDEICKTPNMTLDLEKQMVFDIKKFEHNVNREVRRAYPNRAKLENQCIMALAFSKSGHVLQCPSWVMIINIVAMDMLRSRLPIGLYVKVPNIKNRPRLPVPEEDPYSLTGAGSGTSSGGSSGKEKSGNNKPPKLPPRDNPASNKSSSKGDYDSPEESVFRKFQLSKKNNNNSNTKDKELKYDDPYYCGLRARIPNFAKQPKGKEKIDQNRPQYHPHPQMGMGNPSIFHSRSVDSGMDSDYAESPYAHIYGRLPLNSRAYLSPAHLHSQGFYGRDWD